MKNFLILLLIFFGNFLGTYGFDIQSLKNHTSYVIDQSNILSSQEKTQLEEKILSIKTSYTSEILLLITPTTSGEDISALATKIGQELGVGKSDTDNGIVILIALQDRSWNIATGYGVEGVLPDLLVNKIGNKNFALFKEEKYFEGILGSLNDIDRVLAKDPDIISQLEDNSEKYGIFVPIFFVIFGISSLSLRWLYKKQKYKTITGIALIGYILTLPSTIDIVGSIAILLNLATWGFGVLFGVLSDFSGSSSHRHSSGGFRGGGGGSSSRGGFGGGGFGGGGSSGKW